MEKEEKGIPGQVKTSESIQEPLGAAGLTSQKAAFEQVLGREVRVLQADNRRKGLSVSGWEIRKSRAVAGRVRLGQGTGCG